MLCEGCEGDGAGDCTCAFTAGTAAARIAAVRNGVHGCIIHSPILSAAHIARPAALEGISRGTIQTSHISGEGSNRSEDVTCRKGMPEPTWNLVPELCSE